MDGSVLILNMWYESHVNVTFIRWFNETTLEQIK